MTDNPKLHERVRIISKPLSQRVNDDMRDNFAFERVGMYFAVVADGNNETAVLWSREVWERPLWFRWYPRSYASRLRRAQAKAVEVYSALGGQAVSGQVRCV